MCGIVGIVEQDPGRPVAPQDLERMVRMLHHRGPDEEGSITLPGVGLGMRRLAIVDLASGQQPILNESGDIKVVANGEIYNFHELQRELESHGHRFRSRHSDIEVLVHAYEQWGEQFLGRLRGMFALALWDGRTRTLIAARDRAGEKPLYWTQTTRGLLLASEVKALLVRPEVSRELDPIALDQFLTYEYVLAPRTMLKGVQKLPPAHFLRYRGGEVTVHRYWDAAEVPLKEWKDQDAADALRAALSRAAGRVSVGWHRLELDRRADERGVLAARQQLQHRLCRRHLQRAAVRA
jgi:asparagine synthase (glutamine-hydrolysing)